MSKVKQNIRYSLALCKIKIALFSALSTAAGFCVASSTVSAEMVLPILGIFIIACGSSALNQYQERETDALMERTRERPLPSGNIQPHQALLFSLALLASGLLLVIVTSPPIAAILSLCAVLWYNGVYTYLKRKTAFAVVPGALIGAVPPAIGWLLSGGDLYDPRLASLCFFFFMWQIPHFWVLLIDHGEEYETAGFPSLAGIFTRMQLLRITRHWILATVVSCFFMFLYGLVYTDIVAFLLFAVSGWFVWQGTRLTGVHEVNERLGHFIFKKINYYMASVIILISIDQLAGSRLSYEMAMIMQ